VTASDKAREEKLAAIKAEHSLSEESARKEQNTGPAAARREELARCTAWKRWG
jgi:hypothetical protein